MSVRRPSPHLAAAIAGPLALAAAAVVGALLQPAYSSRREDLSALAATDARWRLVMALGMVAAGLAALAVAAAVWRRAGARAPALALALGGLAVVVAGLSPIDCSERVDAACRARLQAGLGSWHDHAHNLAIVIAVIGMSAAPLLAAATRGWRGLRAISLAAGLGTLALYALYLADPLPGWNGVVQRVAVAVPLLWIALAAARMPRRGEPLHSGSRRLHPRATPGRPAASKAVPVRWSGDPPPPPDAPARPTSSRRG